MVDYDNERLEQINVEKRQQNLLKDIIVLLLDNFSELESYVKNIDYIIQKEYNGYSSKILEQNKIINELKNQYLEIKEKKNIYSKKLSILKKLKTIILGNIQDIKVNNLKNEQCLYIIDIIEDDNSTMELLINTETKINKIFSNK